MSVPSAFLSGLFTRKSFAFSGNTILFYDYLLTLQLEVAYIWGAPWTLVKTLFLLNRYANLIGQTVIMLEETGYLAHGSPHFCPAFQLYISIFSIFSGESIRCPVLVVIRTFAILRFNRTVSVSLSMIYVVYAFTNVVVAVYFRLHLKPFPSKYLNETGVCFSVAPTKLWGMMAVVLIIDTFIFSVVYYRLFKMIRDSRGARPSKLIRLLARDAFLFYIAAAFNVVFTIANWMVYTRSPMNFIHFTITGPFLSVIGQRLILNLRRFRAQPYMIMQDASRDRETTANKQITVMVDQQVWSQSEPTNRMTATRPNSGSLDHEDHWNPEDRGKEAYEMRAIP